MQLYIVVYLLYFICAIHIFFSALQAKFRGSLSLKHEATKKAYGLMDRAASELCTAVKEDFPNAAQVFSCDTIIMKMGEKNVYMCVLHLRERGGEEGRTS